MSLNTGTLDKGIGIEENWHLVPETSFDCVEPFDRYLDKFEREGGNHTDIKKLVSDS